MASELFEDVARLTIRYCDGLDAIASQAWDLMWGLDELTDAIAQDLATAIAGMTETMGSLVSDTPAARSRIEAGAASVETALAALLKAAGASVQEHKDDAARIVAAAGRLQALPVEPAGVLTELAPLIDKSVLGVDEAVEDLSQVLTTEGDAAMEGLKSATAALDTARDALDASHGEWARAFDALTLAAGEKVGAVIAALAEVATVHAKGAVNALNETVPLHNTLAERMAAALGPELAASLEPALKDLEGGRDALQTAVDDHVASLTSRIAEIGEAARERAGELGGVAQGVGVVTGIAG